MIEKTIRRILNEVGISRGSYSGPLQIGVRKFKDTQSGPFTKPELDTPKNKKKKDVIVVSNLK